MFAGLVATETRKKTKNKTKPTGPSLGWPTGLRGLAGPNKRKRKERVIIGLF